MHASWHHGLLASLGSLSLISVLINHTCSLQISDWEQRPMTARQVEYAAQVCTSRAGHRCLCFFLLLA